MLLRNKNIKNLPLCNSPISAEQGEAFKSNGRTLNAFMKEIA